MVWSDLNSVRKKNKSECVLCYVDNGGHGSVSQHFKGQTREARWGGKLIQDNHNVSTVLFH